MRQSIHIAIIIIIIIIIITDLTQYESLALASFSPDI